MQRLAILSDPDYQGGFYTEQRPPIAVSVPGFFPMCNIVRWDCRDLLWRVNWVSFAFGDGMNSMVGFLGMHRPRTWYVSCLFG